MPKIDGLKMSEMIREVDPDAIIIITTAHDERELLHQSIKIGVFDYLIKPLKIDNLKSDRNIYAVFADIDRSVSPQNL